MYRGDDLHLLDILVVSFQAVERDGHEGGTHHLDIRTVYVDVVLAGTVFQPVGELLYLVRQPAFEKHAVE